MVSPSPPHRVRTTPVSLALLLVVALAVVAFANTVSFGFVWDDRILILAGRLPRALDRLIEIFTSDFFHRSEVDNAYGYYRPLTTLSYVWDYTWWRLEPFGYHLTNVLLHATNSVLAFFVLRRFGIGDRPTLVAAALFAVHPIHAESVAWVSGRTDLLAFLFAVAALLLRDSRRGPWLAAVALAAGLLSKEMAVVVVAWALLADVFLERQRLSTAIRKELPLLLTVAAYAVLRFAILDVPGPGTPPQHTPVAILLTFGSTLARYLRWLVLPVAQSAYVTHPYVSSPLDPGFWLSWVFLLALTGGALVAVRRSREGRSIALLLAMLGAAFVPLCGIWRPAGPPDMGMMMAERFAYFPSLPFVGLVAVGIDALWVSRQRGAALAARVGAAALVLALLAATIQRNRVWADEETFLTATLKRAPKAALLWGRLVQHHLERRDPVAAAAALKEARAAGARGRDLLGVEAELLQQQGRISEAIAAQERFARTSRAAAAPALNNLAVLYRKAGRTAEARRILEGLVVDGRAYADVYANLAGVYRESGDLDGARRLYREALRDRPDDLKTAGALVSLEVETGHPDAAESVYEEMLRYHPGNRGLRNNLALLRASMGDDAGAARLFAALVAEHSRYASARVNYAQVLFRLGRDDDALAQLRTAEPLVRGTELEAVVRRQLEKFSAP